MNSLRSPVTCLLFVAIGFSFEASAASFRNNKSVIFPGVICSALLEDVLVQDPDRVEHLEAMNRFADRFLKLDDIYDKIKADPRKIYALADYIPPNNRHLPIQEEFYSSVVRMSELYGLTKKFNADTLSWISTVRGQAEIEKHLKQRKARAEELQLQVAHELRKVQPEIRFDNVGQVVFTATNLTLAYGLGVSALVFGDFGTAIASLALGEVTRRILGASAVSNLQELGLLPIDGRLDNPKYNTSFMNNVTFMIEQLPNMKTVKLIGHSKDLIVSTDHFKAMKACTAENPNVPVNDTVRTCLLERSSILGSGKIGVVREEERQNLLDPRWASPYVSVHDYLFYDKASESPILVTAMIAKARKAHPNKPSRDKDFEVEWKPSFQGL